MPGSGGFRSEEDGEQFRRLFEECLRQSGLSARSLHLELRRRRADVHENTISSWRTLHSSTGRVILPGRLETVRQVAEILCARPEVTVTEDELVDAWRVDKATQAARRTVRPGGPPPRPPTDRLPSGTVTFLSAHGATAADLRDGALGHGGIPVGATLAVFQGPLDAVVAAAAVAASQAASLAVHTGTAAVTASGYAGLAVNHVGRMAAAAHPGQVIVSEAAAEGLGALLPEGLSLVDLGEARLRDLSGSHRFYELRHPAHPGPFPPLRSLDPYPHNLRLQLTTFIGRVEQRDQLRTALRANRLCTLTGIGGSGKTRLALQLAAELIEDFADGVWLVDLASTSAPQVARTVSSVLGVREGGTGTYAAASAGGRRRPVLERLTDHLRHRHVLLVLDNCDRLVQPCAELVDALLGACPNLRILCTSRERLGVAGEEEHRLRPLAVPPAGTPLADGEIAAYESVELFLDRAAHRRPDRRFDGDDLRAVAEICRRVEGLALAVELAAARTRMLSPRQILDLLDDRLDLASADRTGPTRHQTMRATVDWSHDDLSAAQRTLLRRLSVFVGGFELAAAQQVCPGDGLERFEIVDVLGALVDKSLVETDQHAGTTRYRLLETMRAYGAERLAEAGERETGCTRHQEWYLALAEEAEGGLTGTDQVAWLDTLELDHDNLRAALDHRAGAGPQPLRMACALGHFWLVRGFLTEGRQHLDRTLAGAGPPATTLRAKALAVAGHLALFDNDIEAAARLAGEALELAVTLGYRRGQASALRTLGKVATAQDNFDEARRLQDEGLAISRELSDDWGSGFLLTNVANLEVLAGRFEEADAHYRESLDHRRDDAWGLVWSRLRLAVLRGWQGRFDEARTLLDLALETSTRLGYGAGTVLTLLRLGETAHLAGDQQAAAGHFAAARTRARDLEDPTAASLAVVGLAEAALATGDRAEARRWLDTEEATRATGTRETHAARLRAEALLASACGEPARAVELQRRLLGLRHQLGDVPATTEAVERLGILLARAGEVRRGASLLATAAAARLAIGAPPPPLSERLVSAARSRLPAVPHPPSLNDAVAAETEGHRR